MVPMKYPSLVLFSAVVLALPVAAQVKMTPSAGKISVEIDGKPFTDFYMSGKLKVAGDMGQAMKLQKLF